MCCTEDLGGRCKFRRRVASRPYNRERDTNIHIILMPGWSIKSQGSNAVNAIPRSSGAALFMGIIIVRDNSNATTTL